MSALRIERVDGVSVARPREDIDAASARRVRDALAECLDEGSDSLVLDLSETRYVDSAGIDMLFRLFGVLRERRARLQLVIPRDSNLARLAAIVALPSVVPVHESVELALAATRETTA
ncbi:MAG TPA: STAS domain-containing protein [Solirubrobacteraceae bacterium]|nr:STAS domain-containing protein [Solirubrobacteraceae bacterium]